MRLRALAFFCLVVHQIATGQQQRMERSAANGVSRISASLKSFLADTNPDQRFITRRNGASYVSLFLELEPGTLQYPFSQKDIVVRTRTGNIMTVDVPLKFIYELAGMPGIRRLELPLLLNKADTTMKRLVTADRVLAGNAPLTKALTGSNVLIGIIDDGIDVSHDDFIDSNGKSKVLELWNMDRAGSPPPGYSYGHVWPQDSLSQFIDQFNRKSISVFEQQKLVGYGFHGTPVTALAAGKNGVAPGATIVSVALTSYTDTLLKSDRIIDAIAYIYAKAKLLKKKCIVNLSLGTIYGAPHDGKSMIERAIDEFCSEKPDILVVVSAGNSGNTWKHWGGMEVHKDSSFGFFRCAYTASMYFTIPRSNSADLSFSIAESKLGNISSPNISRDSIFYQTPFVNISDIIDSSAPVKFESFRPGGRRASTITFSGSHVNEDYDELIVTTAEYSSGTNGNTFDDHLYRFIFKGTGVVHGWYPFWNLHPIYFFGQNPYPDDSTYRSSDNDFTTGIPSNAFSVLSAGAYNIRECYVSHLHNEIVRGYPACQVAHFSSHGPTLDGRIKPDVIAPGDNVLTARSRMESFMGHQFVIDTNMMSFGGTSAASPITAGVAALIWESDSTLTRNQIIQKIKSSAYNDGYTTINGPVPNNISGYGKIDAFKAITGVTTELSLYCGNKPFCELANTGTGPVLPVPGSETFNLRLYPNPARNRISVSYRSPVPLNMSIYNSIGQLVIQRNLQATNAGFVFDLPIHSLASGSYFVRVSGKDILMTKQILVAGR